MVCMSSIKKKNLKITLLCISSWIRRFSNRLTYSLFLQLTTIPIIKRIMLNFRVKCTVCTIIRWIWIHANHLANSPLMTSFEKSTFGSFCLFRRMSTCSYQCLKTSLQLHQTQPAMTPCGRALLSSWETLPSILTQTTLKSDQSLLSWSLHFQLPLKRSELSLRHSCARQKACM